MSLETMASVLIGEWPPPGPEISLSIAPASNIGRRESKVVHNVRDAALEYSGVDLYNPRLRNCARSSSG
jgi:hypothetical protein